VRWWRDGHRKSTTPKGFRLGIAAVAVNQDRIRLYDLDSTSGTYVNDERIQTAELEHLSEFRVGSSLLLVTISPENATLRWTHRLNNAESSIPALPSLRQWQLISMLAAC